MWGNASERNSMTGISNEEAKRYLSMKKSVSKMTFRDIISLSSLSSSITFQFWNTLYHLSGDASLPVFSESRYPENVPKFFPFIWYTYSFHRNSGFRRSLNIQNMKGIWTMLTVCNREDKHRIFSSSSPFFPTKSLIRPSFLCDLALYA